MNPLYAVNYTRRALLVETDNRPAAERAALIKAGLTVEQVNYVLTQRGNA